MSHSEVDYEIRASTQRINSDLREVEYILFRSLSLMGRLGLPPDIDAAINKIQRVIYLLRVMHSTMMFLSRSTWYGLALGILTGGAGIIATVDLMNDLG